MGWACNITSILQLQRSKKKLCFFWINLKFLALLTWNFFLKYILNIPFLNSYNRSGDWSLFSFGVLISEASVLFSHRVQVLGAQSRSKLVSYSSHVEFFIPRKNRPLLKVVRELSERIEDLFCFQNIDLHLPFILQTLYPFACLTSCDAMQIWRGKWAAACQLTTCIFFPFQRTAQNWGPPVAFMTWLCHIPIAFFRKDDKKKEGRVGRRAKNPLYTHGFNFFL